SKRLVDLHNGKIEAESRGRSCGATFKVVLDTVPDGSAGIGLNHRNGGKTAKPLRILLVEDHHDTRRTLSRLLTHFGHRVVTADTSKGQWKSWDRITSTSCCVTLVCPMAAATK